MSTKQSSMLSFFGNGSTLFEESDVLDEGALQPPKKKRFFQSLKRVVLKVRVYFNW